LRYGILGDIHSNLPALRAVLDAMGRERFDRVLCLGDLVGYGAQPTECVDLVRELDPVLVAGNHDWAAAGRLGLDFFNGPARAAIVWTQAAMTRDRLDWLGTLPLVLVEGEVTLAHSTVHDPQVFDYLQTPYDAYLSFRSLSTRRAFVGHSHVPITFFEGMPILYAVGERIELDGRRSISNVGSVGQPRDEDTRAAFGIYDETSGLLEIRRVAYDVEEAAETIRRAGLPSLLAERLRLGR
jgi:diadenosine tetraphosphatase ApaH/serine/threonine PP2A family protein phosphatase